MVVLVTALITVAGTLGAVVVGQRLARGGEQTAWLRERRRIAYGEFIVALWAAHAYSVQEAVRSEQIASVRKTLEGVPVPNTEAAATTLVDRILGHDGPPGTVTNYVAVRTALASAIAQVRLVAGEAVVAEAEKLAEKASLREEWTTYQADVDRFTRLARADLH